MSRFDGLPFSKCSFTVIIAFLCNRLAPQIDTKIVIPKMSSRNVIGVVGGRLYNRVNEFDTNAYLKQCQERRQNDPNYTEQQFNIDRSRLALKMPPNYVQNVQSSIARDDEIDSTFAVNGSNYDDDDGGDGDDDYDDSGLDDFDDLSTNQHVIDDRFFDRFSPDSSMAEIDMMNLATPESHSSFFY